MKGSFRHLRVVTASAIVLGLAGCGGNAVTDVAISGTVSGLTTGTLILSNVLSQVILPAGSTKFTFPSHVSVGVTLAVSVTQQPEGLTCKVANGTLVVGTQDITNVTVTCATNNSLGGTITGLRSGSLTLANGSSTVKVDSPSTTFVFPNKIIAGTAYGVTVLTQPAGLTCSVAKGAGIMGATDASDVAVTCI